MSNSTYNEIEDNIPRKSFAQEREERMQAELDKAYNFILELVEDDPSTLCEVVMDNYEDWCEKHCENFNHDCLKKFLTHYKKEE